MQTYSTAELDRFWNKVQKTDTCWLWTGSIDNLGYGRIRGWTKAHRASWQIHFGPIPAGLNVCHSCDVRHCVRPDHLWLGTQKENVHDMIRKGRDNRATGDRNGSRTHIENMPRGEKNTKAKLTTPEVLEIRRLYLEDNLSQEKIGKMFNVSQNRVSMIVLRKHWKHI